MIPGPDGNAGNSNNADNALAEELYGKGKSTTHVTDWKASADHQ
ncbi:hypothetical protein [Nocardia rhizosphaerae]|uniref:Transposase n=1 Tax=Nocardia rhizosphaerae TaxID=1691571 RepID=A0ABV8L283_9NOCA